eukprot:627999-Amphidinium_carterae.1
METVKAKMITNNNRITKLHKKKTQAGTTMLVFGGWVSVLCILKTSVEDAVPHKAALSSTTFALFATTDS